MKQILTVSFFIFFVTTVLGENQSSQWFDTLDKTIEEKYLFEQQKLKQIEVLSKQVQVSENELLEDQFAAFQNLHLAYYNFDYDSAMAYALNMVETANHISDPLFLSQAKLCLGSTLLASGIFNEAKDTLSSIDITFFNDSLKIEYYYDFSRLYFDMIDYYQRSFFIDRYLELGLQYLDSAIALTPANSEKFYSLNGLKLVRTFKYGEALQNYQTLFEKYTPTGRQFAIDASTYGFVLEQNSQLEEGMGWLIRAAIEDIKLANKENVALINLANKLYHQGNIEMASEYLNVALEDASTYGALQRKFQISQIQPIVEATRLQMTEAQKSRIKRYALSVTLLVVLIVVILFVLFRQFQKIKAARNEVNKTNEKLKRNNQKLREVNLIKEEYIGQFFKTNSDLIDKLDNFRQSIENKVMTKKLDELNSLLKKQTIKDEREEMYRTFDSVFLNIFPDFVSKFNALFDEENQIELKHSEQMNTDLRIFALIRLGISDTEKIAHILDYSVNTINTYKTKIKNRSKVSNEDFEKEILRIESI